MSTILYISTIFLVVLVAGRKSWNIHPQEINFLFRDLIKIKLKEEQSKEKET